jgi:hypothetical protein
LKIQLQLKEEIMEYQENVRNGGQERELNHGQRFGQSHDRDQRKDTQDSGNDNPAKPDAEGQYSRQGYRNSDEYREEEARLNDSTQMDDHAHWRNEQVTRVGDVGEETHVKHRIRSVESTETRDAGDTDGQDGDEADNDKN